MGSRCFQAGPQYVPQPNVDPKRMTAAHRVNGTENWLQDMSGSVVESSLAPSRMLSEVLVHRTSIDHEPPFRASSMALSAQGVSIVVLCYQRCKHG